MRVHWPLSVHLVPNILPQRVFTQPQYSHTNRAYRDVDEIFHTTHVKLCSAQDMGTTPWGSIPLVERGCAPYHKTVIGTVRDPNVPLQSLILILHPHLLRRRKRRAAAYGVDRSTPERNTQAIFGDRLLGALVERFTGSSFVNYKPPGPRQAGLLTYLLLSDQGSCYALPLTITPCDYYLQATSHL